MFLDRVGGHKRCNLLYDPSHFVLQQLDYLEYIDLYHERIRMFHVKDAEFNPTGRQGVYGGFQPWIDRAGRFRSLGDGQVNFKAIFSKLAQYDYPGWAVLEWECCLKHPEDGAREGAKFIADHIIRVTEKAFDDFAGAGTDVAANRRMRSEEHTSELQSQSNLVCRLLLEKKKKKKITNRLKCLTTTTSCQHVTL